MIPIFFTGLICASAMWSVAATAQTSFQETEATARENNIAEAIARGGVTVGGTVKLYKVTSETTPRQVEKLLHNTRLFSGHFVRSYSRTIAMGINNKFTRGTLAAVALTTGGLVVYDLYDAAKNVLYKDTGNRTRKVLPTAPTPTPTQDRGAQ
jgi:hypothetical protein